MLEKIILSVCGFLAAGSVYLLVGVIRGIINEIREFRKETTRFREDITKEIGALNATLVKIGINQDWQYNAILDLQKRTASLEARRPDAAL